MSGFEKHFNDAVEACCVGDKDDVTVKLLFNTSKCNMMYTWNHQQIRITELEERLKEADSIIKNVERMYDLPMIKSGVNKYLEKYEVGNE